MTDTPEDPGSEPDVAADIGPDPQAGLVEVLVAAGLDSDEVERARVHGHLELLALDHLVLPEHAPFDVVQVAEATGVPQELVARLWRSLGFADPQPGEQIFLPAARASPALASASAPAASSARVRSIRSSSRRARPSRIARISSQRTAWRAVSGGHQA